MTEYFVVFFLYIVCMGLAYTNFIRYKNLIFLLGLLPLFLLVAFRGSVGTDTAAYLNIVSVIQASGTFVGIEQGFIYLVKAFLCLSGNPMAVLVLLALVTTTVLLLASKTDDRALFVFIVCIAPLFYLDMTMNGLRYGLSFAFAMLTISKFYQHHLLVSVALSVVAVLFHVSGLLLFLIAALLADNKYEFVRWLKLVGVTLLVVLVQYYWADVIQSLLGYNIFGQLDADAKYMAYKNFSSPSWYSGLSTLIISWLLLYILHGGNNDKALLEAHQFYILVLLTIMTFILAKFSYAGLRLQFVVLFAMLSMMQFKPALAGIMDKARRKGILAIGYLGLLVFVKNLISTQGQGLSPFAPWRFNPDLVQLWKVLT